MRIDAAAVGDEPEVTTDLVPGQNLQPWMLLYNADSGQAHVVIADPDPFRQEGASGRLERWVTLSLLDAELLPVPATGEVEIVYGAPLDELQPLLPEDLYSTEEEALARNGMCHVRVGDHVDDDDDEEEPVYCGRPSEPVSFYRDCTGHDQVRRDGSELLVDRGFDPIYGATADIP